MNCRERLISVLLAAGVWGANKTIGEVADFMLARGVTFAKDDEVARRGRWEPREDLTGFVRCSACHDCNIYDEWADGKKWQYCPHCGAKMEG